MPDGNNLTIDFSDASFDNSSENEQPVPGVDNIDVVFPIDDNPEITLGSGDYAKTGHDFSDNRATSTAPASAIALMPTDAASSAMEEFLFEFDNDLNDDGPGTDQGLKITTSGGSGDQQVVQEINLNGTFENLDTDGSLDVHVSKDPSGNVFEKVTLGEGSDTSGNDNIIFVGGDTNGGDTGAGDDVASINVDASATMGGVFKGGSGYDMIKLVEGVREDNGASVDFTFGINGPNSAFVSNLGGVGDDMSFDIDEFESIQLTDNNDVIFIGSETGASLTDAYDAVYLNGGGTNSMMKVQTGFIDGGMADVMYVHADSNVYLSFEFANESGLGVEATFGANGDVNVDGHIHGSLGDDMGTDGEIIGVSINQSGGAGSMTIDYFEATNNHDMITNLGDIGILVNLGGSDGMADVFTGSETSDNDVLDVRNVDDLVFADPGSGYITINDTVDGTLVNAEVKNVDFIMVSNDVQNANDVDFYQDMTHLNGTKLIDGVGQGATDAYGVGYDVVTSAQVDSFAAGSDMRVYYEGKHSDFIDTDDIVNGTEGIFDMSEGKSDRGSNWESEVDSQYGPGQEPGFFIEVSGKKLAVTFDDEKGEWKVDSSAIQVAEDAMITKNLDGMTEGAFAQSVIDRYGLQPASGTSDGDSTGTENSYPDRAASHDGYYYGYGSGSGSYGYGSGSGSYGYGSGSGSYGYGSGSGDNSSGDGFPAVSITGNTADGTISLTVGHNGTYWVLDGSETGDGLAYTNRYYDNIVSLLNDLRNDIGDSYFDELRAMSPNPNDFNNEALKYLSPLRWNDYLSYNTSSGDGSGSGSYGDGSGSGSYGDGSGSGSYGDGSGSGSYGDGSGSGSYGDGSGSGSYGDGSGSGGDTSGGDSLQEANSPAYSFSDDIYLNASEEAITELLATGIVSDKAFNFSFYTKMDVASGDGMVTVNLKLQDTATSDVDTWLYDQEQAGNPIPVIADAVAETSVNTYTGSELSEAGADVVNSASSSVTLYDAWDLAGYGFNTSGSGLFEPATTITLDAVATKAEILDYFAQDASGNPDGGFSGNAANYVPLWGIYFQPIDAGNMTNGAYAQTVALNADGSLHSSVDPDEFNFKFQTGINRVRQSDNDDFLSHHTDYDDQLQNLLDNVTTDQSLIDTTAPITLRQQVLMQDFVINGTNGSTFAASTQFAVNEEVDGSLTVQAVGSDGNISPIKVPISGVASDLGDLSTGTTQNIPGANSPLNSNSEYVVTIDDVTGNMTAQEFVSGAATGPVLSLETGDISGLTANKQVIQAAQAAVTQEDIDAYMAGAPDPSYSFELKASDIDVAVESFYNVAEDAGAGVTSSSAAGEFVKIDNSADIALGNGGDDTYVVGADSGIYGGVALEYGNIGQYGGLTGSIDAVNINSVDSVEELTFRRGEFRNEEEGNTLFIGDGNGQETVLFDNYNEYLDFRRVEYLTVEDGANNDEIFEIVTNTNLSDWDNEIYVADSDGGVMNVELGGLDYVFGSTGVDDIMIDIDDLIGADKAGTIKFSGLDSNDTLTLADNGIFDDSTEADIQAALDAGIAGGDATVTFSYVGDTLSLVVDSTTDELNMNEQYQIMSNNFA